MSQIVAVPELDDLRLYMQREGWVERPPGPAGSLWSNGSFEIAVPASDDDARLVHGVLERLASWAKEESVDLSERIRYYSVDVTDLRADMFDSSVEAIPLGVAEVMTRSARTLIRSAATTASRPRGDLRGNYSRLSEELVAKARMGHTKRGSFIIPILVPLPSAESLEPDVQMLDDPTRVAVPEPYERRAVRTLAQSLQAIQNVIIDPGKAPTMNSLHDAIELGVSRELCQAVSELLSQPSIIEFDALFSWGGLVKAPARLPRTVRLSAEGRDLVEMASERLRQVHRENSRTFSGNIVGLRRVGVDSTGYVSVATIRNGRSAEITVSLPYRRYKEALRWHDDGRVILVEGEIEKEKGHLVVKSPLRCHPIDDLLSMWDRDHS